VPVSDLDSRGGGYLPPREGTTRAKGLCRREDDPVLKKLGEERKGSRSIKLNLGEDLHQRRKKKEGREKETSRVAYRRGGAHYLLILKPSGSRTPPTKKRKRVATGEKIGLRLNEKSSYRENGRGKVNVLAGSGRRGKGEDPNERGKGKRYDLAKTPGG